MNYAKLQELLPRAIAGEFDHLYLPVVQKLHCMSTPRVYSIINACVSSMDFGTYVEVGTYQGGSMISALLGNNSAAIGVDSFGEFKETNNLQITTGNFQDFGVADRVTMHEKSFQEFFATLPAAFPIDVYNYDGAHDEETQLAGMEAAWRFLRPGSLILVDDFTYPEVQRAVNRFVANHINTVKFLFMMDPIHNTDPIWWNGCVILRVTDERGSVP